MWLAFYFVDKVWYHRLLIGSVIFGQTLETQISEVVGPKGLTKTISEASPYQVHLRGLKIGKPIHSDQKLSGFYLIVAAVLLALILGAQFGTTGGNATPRPSPSSPTTIVPNHVPKPVPKTSSTTTQPATTGDA